VQADRRYGRMGEGVTFGQRWMEAPAVVRIYESAFRPLVTRIVGGPSYAQEEAWLGQWCRPAGSGPVLDVACGTGRYTRWLQAVHGRMTVGLDLSEPMLRVAGEAGATVFGGSAQALPLRDQSVSAVNCFGALHLFPDPAGALAEFGRVLAPGGSLTVFTGLRHDGPLQRLLPVVDWVGEADIRGALETAGIRLETWEPRGWMLLFGGVRM
jgi:SAM-dependent methyltransferase